MATNISKASGVLFVTQGTQNPTSYFGATGSYQFTDDNTQIIIKIGSTPSIITAWTNVQVNGQTPSTVTEAKTLLNSIFGT